MEEVSLAAGSSSTLSPIAHRPRGRAPGLTLPLYLLYTYIIDIYFLPIFTAYPASSFRINETIVNETIVNFISSAINTCNII